RVEARGRALPAGVIGPRFDGELLELEHDLPALAATEFSAQPRLGPTWIAVRAGARGVQTLRLGRDAARILGTLEGRRSLDQLEREQPGLGGVLERWHAAGWVESLS